MFNSRFESLSICGAAFLNGAIPHRLLGRKTVAWKRSFAIRQKLPKSTTAKIINIVVKTQENTSMLRQKTIFQGTRIPLISWFEAIWTILSYKKEFLPFS